MHDIVVTGDDRNSSLQRQNVNTLGSSNSTKHQYIALLRAHYVYKHSNAQILAYGALCFLLNNVSRPEQNIDQYLILIRANCYAPAGGKRLLYRRITAAVSRRSTDRIRPPIALCACCGELTAFDPQKVYGLKQTTFVFITPRSKKKSHRQQGRQLV